MKITPYDESFRDQVIALTLDAWRPVFPKTRSDVPLFVYENIWPQGWETRQATDVGSLIDSNPGEIWLAMENDSLVGFVGAAMVMVETVGDSGHEPARKAYESQGYVLWPVARYFKEL